jgi:penicillin-binding protein 1A
MGVGDVPSVPSLALGSGEVTLQAMTAAYAAFANHGLVPAPMLVRRVEDNEGRLLYAGQESSTRAVTETTAFLMSTMLADVINAGTGNRARQLGFTLPAAGKTGTTNDFNDAWFIGFTPKLVTGVWVGFDQPRTILPNGFAADVAVPAWAKFMKSATANDKPEWFSAPAGIRTASVCRLSGKLATEGCQDVEVVGKDGELLRKSMVYTEYFDRGTEPTSYCELHPTHSILGKIAGVFGAGEKPAPPHVEHADTDTGTRSPSVAVATGGDVERVEAAPLPPKKKRGFWSRIFGRGKDADRDEIREAAPPKKKS